MCCRSRPGATPLGEQTPHPRSAPPALPLSLELPRDLPHASPLPPKPERSAARPPGGDVESRGAGKRPGTLASARLGGQRETPRLHFRTIFEAVSRSSLLVVPCSSPAANHVLRASPPALASAVVFPVLSFSTPEELAHVSRAPPHPG